MWIVVETDIGIGFISNDERGKEPKAVCSLACREKIAEEGDGRAIIQGDCSRAK